jgi:hypothetical protein
MLSTPPDPFLPPVKHCMNTYPCTYSHREGGFGGVGEPVRSLERHYFTGRVENNNMTDCISSF